MDVSAWDRRRSEDSESRLRDPRDPVDEGSMSVR